jgi:hypothetical protein
MSYRTKAVIVLALAFAMAYLESAVVVYLRRALEITPDDLFPLRGQDVVGNLAAIEVGREFATLVMLAAIGCLAGRRWVDRLAWTAVAFGAWDIAYYGWLWVFLGWPHGLDTWDVLFLIPVPWAGPVWAPVGVSLALLGFGLAAAWGVREGVAPRIGFGRAAVAVLGGLLVILSFTVDAQRLVDGGLPGPYAWPLYAVGMALAVGAASSALRSGVRERAGWARPN